MSESFSLKLDIKSNNLSLVKNTFNILLEYISEENNTDNLLNAFSQITPLLEVLIQKNDSNLEFMDTEQFKNFKNILKLLSSYPQSQKLLTIINGKNDDIYSLKSILDDYLDKDNQNSKNFLANAYFDFYQTLKSSLANEDYSKIKESWNKNVEFFESERITHNIFNSKFPNYKFSKEVYSTYFKFIKISQEKIANLLWTHFLNKPEKAEELNKFSPDFFQFISWHERSEQTARDFIALLEQKHFDNLKYASKITGFNYFLEKIFLLTEKDVIDSDSFDPFSSNAVVEYNYINIDIIKKLNSKNINIDVVLKDNTLGLPYHFRDYLYKNITEFEKTGKKHSSIEFQELDKLLTIYEKQKLESIFIPKNTKEKLHKI